MKPSDIGILTLLASLWGASFLFMRVASPVLGPVVLIDLRVLIAGIALVLYAGILRQRPYLLNKWKEYLLLGASNAAIPFCLIAAAEIHLDASLAAILNAMTPLFTAIISYVWTKDPFTKKKFVGLVLGTLGVAVLVGWNPKEVTGRTVMAVFLSLAAAFFYGIGGVYSAKAFKDEKPLNLAIGQQLAAGIILLPVAAFFLPHRVPRPEVVWSVLGLALLSTSLGYLLYFRLIRNVGPVKTLCVTFLVPIFGVLWGRLFLGERLSFGTLLGLMIILVSVTLITNIPLRWRRKQGTITLS